MPHRRNFEEAISFRATVHGAIYGAASQLKQQERNFNAAGACRPNAVEKRKLLRRTSSAKSTPLLPPQTVFPSIAMALPQETLPRSPFALREHDRRVLEDSVAFARLRALLKGTNVSGFCPGHQTCTQEDKDEWILHRDITSALILPIIHIFREASQLASAYLCSKRCRYDLELAFRGDARGTFSWLQCLLMEEQDWCLTNGCPACVVSYILQSEPTVRLVLAACRLSRSYSKPSSPALACPNFDFWRASVRRALDKDQFWGSKYSKNMEERGGDLEAGIRQLVGQCNALEDLVAANKEREVTSDGDGENVSCPVECRGKCGGPEPRRRPRAKSNAAGRGTAEQWLQRSVEECWEGKGF